MFTLDQSQDNSSSCASEIVGWWTITGIFVDLRLGTFVLVAHVTRIGGHADQTSRSSSLVLPMMREVLEELELLYNVTYFSVRFIRSLFDTLNFEKVISDPGYKLFLAIRLSDSPENYLALKSFDFSGYTSRRDLLFGIITHLTSSELVPLQNRVLFQTAQKYAFLDNLYINTSFINALSRYEAFRNQRDHFDENDPNYEKLKNLMIKDFIYNKFKPNLKKSGQSFWMQMSRVRSPALPNGVKLSLVGTDKELLD
ncbi:unnamed protein product [Timema podura]|uniref:Uncharacterized protein n=1 Tax=Timema podura TaxID=61482 RepID=A0ABN7NFI8_TIMPD|nr:unnamed protein product [Timema podura]